MTEQYKFKTDRKKQWTQLEERYLREGYPKKSIEYAQSIFNGELKDGFKDDTLTTLAYWPDRSIGGWQYYFDNYCNETLSWSRVFGLQAGILSGFYGAYQCPEDDAYYVRSLWGAIWEPGLLMKLRIPAEEGAIYPLDPNVFFACGGSTLSAWIKEEVGETTCGGYMRFMPEFFRSLIPHLDKRCFDTKKYSFKEKVSDEVPVRVSQMKGSIITFIKYSHKTETGNLFYDQRIAVAKQFYSMFDEIKEHLGDFSLLVEETLSEKK